MHVAAALDKPCVVLAGGREPKWWEAYLNAETSYFGRQCASVQVPHRYLDTIGRLPCCEKFGCWKTHVTAAETTRPEACCVDPVNDGFGQTIPHCLKLIIAEDVVAAVLSYRDVAGRE